MGDEIFHKPEESKASKGSKVLSRRSVTPRNSSRLSLSKHKEEEESLKHQNSPTQKRSKVSEVIENKKVQVNNQHESLYSSQSSQL